MDLQRATQYDGVLSRGNLLDPHSFSALLGSEGSRGCSFLLEVALSLNNT